MSNLISPRTAAARIVAIYAFFAAVWIIASDATLGFLVHDPQLITTLSVVKGWVFVLLTAILLYQLIIHDTQKRNTIASQLQAVLDAASEFAIIATDTRGTITLFNHGAEKLLGFHSAELVGQCTPVKFHLEEEIQQRGEVLCHELNRPVSGFEIFVDYALAKGMDSHDWTWVRKDGTLLPVRIVITPLRDQSGELRGYLGIASDISKQRATEDSLRERVASGIRELRQKDDLLQSQSRLAAMGEMLTNIAHQWRQPLNNIALLIQGLKYSYDHEEMTADEMERSVSSTLEICRYMSHTINDFRNFFRQEPDKCEFSINQAVERTISLIQMSLSAHKISLVTEMNEELSSVGYPNEYSQALMNIINNARDALLERKVPDPRIIVRIHRQGHLACVSISDNAGGIKPDILPHIFAPYFTTKDKSQGTGIGLYMAKTILEKNMGGSLTVVSATDGAEFRIATSVAKENGPPGDQADR